ncbi:hypothetical protein HNY73_017170 [Argiope bruennichi]|uniref:Uncharacterized protein n=1 Tax=Argiope bruennichi TaxID=94029 RepID=A0A8T0EKZ6_ARGBR|nr:hypothetical protein HNY73_017170 [Argiope bruennichi]
MLSSWTDLKIPLLKPVTCIPSDRFLSCIPFLNISPVLVLPTPSDLQIYRHSYTQPMHHSLLYVSTTDRRSQYPSLWCLLLTDVKQNSNNPKVQINFRPKPLVAVTVP